MPAEEETTTITVPAATTPEPIVKEPTNAEAESPEKSPTAEPIEKTTETTEQEETREEAKKDEAVQEGSKSKEDENKENVQQNGSKVEKNASDAVETKGKAEADEQTEGIVLRKRRTPEKIDGSKEEDVSPPKKVK